MAKQNIDITGPYFPARIIGGEKRPGVSQLDHLAMEIYVQAIGGMIETVTDDDFKDLAQASFRAANIFFQERSKL